VRAAAGIVCKLASLIQSIDSIKEAEINPVIVYPEGKGAVALDALIVGR
jgi:acetate---CoA ligase (ADP-forming)